MSYVRKFERGEPFGSLDALARWCLSGGWVFWQPRRPQCGLAFINMQFGMIARAVEAGRVYRAAIRPEWQERQMRRARKGSV